MSDLKGISMTDNSVNKSASGLNREVIGDAPAKELTSPRPNHAVAPDAPIPFEKISESRHRTSVFGFREMAFHVALQQRVLERWW